MKNWMGCTVLSFALVGCLAPSGNVISSKPKDLNAVSTAEKPASMAATAEADASKAIAPLPSGGLEAAPAAPVCTLLGPSRVKLGEYVTFSIVPVKRFDPSYNALPPGGKIVFGGINPDGSPLSQSVPILAYAVGSTDATSQGIYMTRYTNSAKAGAYTRTVTVLNSDGSVFCASPNLVTTVLQGVPASTVNVRAAGYPCYPFDGDFEFSHATGLKFCAGRRVVGVTQGNGTACNIPAAQSSATTWGGACASGKATVIAIYNPGEEEPLLEDNINLQEVNFKQGICRIHYQCL